VGAIVVSNEKDYIVRAIWEWN